MREEFLRTDHAQGCIVCYCTVQYVGVTRYSTSIVVYPHLLHRHTSVTMSARKKEKCDETMTVPCSTMESECCEEKANNRHSVLVGECKPLSSYYGVYAVITKGSLMAAK